MLSFLECYNLELLGILCPLYREILPESKVNMEKSRARRQRYIYFFNIT